MARSSTGIVVAGLTAAALAVVGVLAVQASAAKDRADRSAEPRPSASASATEQGGTGAGKAEPVALPTASGEGRRVVYSLESDRVWLVDEAEQVSRTFEVTPGTLDPLPGTYQVTSRSARITGTDNVPVENVVRFTSVDGVTIGFSAAVDGATPTPDPAKQTGGIRESRKDGAAMWVFATLETKVVVVP